jgi:hypothetical protein
MHNPVLERLLPSLLQIKAVTVLDAALKDALEKKCLSVPRQLGTGLKARITFLAQLGHLPSADRLQRIRESRNDVAHEFEEHISWKELADDVDAIQQVLTDMGYAPTRPELKVVAERSAARSDATVGVAFAFDYTVSVKEGDRVLAEIRWTKRILNDDE